MQPQLPRRSGQQGPVDIATAAELSAENSDASADDDPDRLRRVVARESRRLATLEAAHRKAATAALKLNLVRDEVAQAIADQGSTTGELQESVDLGDEFVWNQPLSKARVIAYLDRLNQPEPQQSSPQRQLQRQQQKQQVEHQEDSQQVEAVEPIDDQPIEQAGSDTPAGTHFFLLAPVAEQFGIAADDSEGTESEASLASVDADDAFWLSELHAAESSDRQSASRERPDEPSDDGGRPGKRHRPG